MLAETFEIVGSVRGDVVEALALTLRGFAWRLFAFRVKILMVFEFMIAEALSLGADHFTVHSFAVAPAEIQSVFAFFGNGQPSWLSDIHIFEFFR